jgi:hypothetical protein
MESFVSVVETRIWQCFGQFALSMTEQKDQIKAYDQFIQSKIDTGWDPYLITFMFNTLLGNHSSKIRQMKSEIERIYSTFLTRVVRYPHSDRDLPILIAIADIPVRKRKK